MSKDELIVVNENTGEVLPMDVLEEIRRKEYNQSKNRAEWLYENDPEKMSLEQIELLRKIRRKNGTVKINYKKDGYCIVKNNHIINNTLNIHTRGFLWSICDLMTDEGRLIYRNNKPIKTIKSLLDEINISKNDYTRHIRKDVDDYGLIKKEKIEERIYLIVNPLFIMKGERVITETLFITFHKQLREHLDPLDYIYLSKKHKIKPN